METKKIVEKLLRKIKLSVEKSAKIENGLISFPNLLLFFI